MFWQNNNQARMRHYQASSSPVLLVMALIAVILGMFLTGAAYAGTVNLPVTGQTKSSDANTPQRDDGALRKGVAWPNPRFKDNGNKTVTDTLTGLVWSKDGVVPKVGSCVDGIKNWQGALDYVVCLNTNKYLGYSDWRLPNVNELESLINAGQADTSVWLNKQGFTNVQSNYYWSSTTCAKDGNTSTAWGVRMASGSVGSTLKSSYHYVWPIRSGESGALSPVWSTGQTATHAAGDDGALQKGVAWPAPRFADSDKNTVTDTLTGLVWSKDAGTPEVGSCTGGANSWQMALDYVQCLNGASYLGYTDWRLPNKTELYSLINRGMSSPALSSGHPFTNVQSGNYWSSTVYPEGASYAWSVSMEDGKADISVKSSSGYVWPVSDGKAGNVAFLQGQGSRAPL
ncbi:DUF1566 domain-containing protein [Candidatus Magnetobacterium casense]|uniref:DUF1566 domain-containing protein n=1 Tax=Candidatus Magnetobacterium casense TaxID=1455061 RepID=A0ABS6S0K3_9BACT|nr:DUF1566 domain-containing protein [Candidatus Magnetobacterium casensis]MBV6342392.1 DUF1566 domain-containing protein [Candidatus Magnetobacterium casensis]